MDTNFYGKIALITGGASGIGRSTAIALSRLGATVVVADIADDEQVVPEIMEKGGKAVYLKCDVSKASDVFNLLSTISSKFGRLDIAVNNAGIEGVNAPTQECSEANWDKVIDINLKGIWLCMKHELHMMQKQQSGTIVNVSSVAGLVGFAGMAPYVASKHAIIGLTKSAALENAELGIRINAICPGVIRTAMIDRLTGNDPTAEKTFESMAPMGRMGQPSEIADGIVWLCSDASSFVIGNSLVVDGGLTIP